MHCPAALPGSLAVKLKYFISGRSLGLQNSRLFKKAVDRHAALLTFTQFIANFLSLSWAVSWPNGGHQL
jgi:ABC-type microcin C transport system permease subunit YejB